jgi:hypothetical protein
VKQLVDEKASGLVGGGEVDGLEGQGQGLDEVGEVGVVVLEQLWGVLWLLLGLLGLGEVGGSVGLVGLYLCSRLLL